MGSAMWLLAKGIPPPPKLPSHIRPRVCRFGMKCANPRCTFIHIKAKSGKAINQLGLAGMTVDSLPRERLSWSAPENVYIFNDDGLPEVSGLGSSGEDFFKEDESEIHADPLGLCCE